MGQSRHLKNSNSPQSWGTSWDEKICKQNLSTILISRDRAVCLQFGAKIQNNLGDLKRVSGEIFFYILSLKVVFSGLKSIKGQKTRSKKSLWWLLTHQEQKSKQTADVWKKCKHTKWPAMDEERLELYRFFLSWVVGS